MSQFLKIKWITLNLGLVCLSWMNTYSQDLVKVDSLLSSLETSSLNDKYPILIELTFQFVDLDNRKSLEFVDQAFSISNMIGDTSKIVQSGRIKGQLLNRMERVTETIKLLSKLLPISKRNGLQSDYKTILNTLAIAHTLTAEYDKALRYHFESLVIREREGDKLEISITLNNIGLVYFKLKSYEKAIKYYEKSLKLKKEVDDKYDLEVLLINTGLCYNQLNNFDKAQEFIQEGLSGCDLGCSEQILMGGEFGLGVSSYGLLQYETAITHFKESYKHALSSGNSRYQAENLIYLGRISMVQDSMISAQAYLSKAEQLATASGYNELLIEVLKQFTLFYDRTNDFKNSFTYQNKYVSLKDSVYNTQVIENLTRAEADFAERENIAKLNHQKEVLALKEESISRKNVMIALICFSTLLIATIALLLFRSNKSRKVANELLENKIKERTHQLQESHNQLIVQIQERNKEIKSSYKELTSLAATLKGIVNIGKNEVDQKVVKACFEEAGKAVDQVTEITKTSLDRQ